MKYLECTEDGKYTEEAFKAVSYTHLGKGVVSMKDKNAHGDQYVVIQIQVPRNLTPAAKEKLQEYKKVSGF